MLESSVEIEREFYRDVRQKKRTGNGIHSKTGIRGYTGTVVFPSTYLKGKAKKAYEKNGEVVSYSMFQSLMHIDEFQRKPKEEQKLVMENWRKIYKNKEIYEGLAIPKSDFYDLLTDLGVEKKEAGPRSKKHMDVIPHEGIMPLDEFQAISLDNQKETLIKLREDFPTETIKKAWGLSTGSFYSMMKKLGIQTKTPKPSGNKKIDFVKFLTGPELLPYGDLKTLSLENQAELLDEYKDRYGSLTELSKAWGVPVATLYGLSSRLKNVTYVHTERPEEQESLSFEELLKQTAAAVEAPAVEVPSEDVEPPTPEVAPADEELKNEVKELRELVSQLLNEQKVPQQPTVMAEGSKVETPTSTQGFSLNYESEKEGFLLQYEIQQFIRMLEKNPDSFKVQIKITKVE